ncbi:hypothetical protein ACLGGT_07100 [Roseovarius sp. MS2]|uniref:hypothetical protein n=1 Tax=Roseovarius sp. MS2 TaxID=3390728 RepID=UPI003EDC11C2
MTVQNIQKSFNKANEAGPTPASKNNPCGNTGYTSRQTSKNKEKNTAEEKRQKANSAAKYPPNGAHLGKKQLNRRCKHFSIAPSSTG